MATEVNKILLEIELDASGVVKNADQVNAQLKKLGASADIVNKQLKGTKDASGAAGAAVAEFGRLVSDAPYGIQAVTNNLSQLGSMFAVTAANAGGAKNAIKEMVNVVFKAGRVTMVGWLIAFQAVIAAIDYFTRSTKKAKGETEDFSNALILQKGILDSIRTSFMDGNKDIDERIRLLETLALTDENLQNILKDGTLADEERIKKGEEYIDNIKSVEQAEKDLLEARKAIEKDGRSLDELRAERAEKEAEISALKIEAQTSADATTKLGAILEIALRKNQIASIDALIQKYEFLDQQLISSAKLRESVSVEKPEEEEKRAKEIADLQEELALVRIKIEKDRLEKELKFIDEKLAKEKEGSAEYLKLQIKREEVLDSLAELSKERNEEEKKRKEALRELEQEIILESIYDERERLRQKIAFLDEEMSKEVESAENYKKLQLEKIKAVNALASAEKKAQDEIIKEDDKVNNLRAKLFQARLSENEVLERKWLKSQIDSLEQILKSESLANEQRAQAELDLYNYKKELLDKEQKDRESVVNSLKIALDTASDLVDSNADRQIATETNKTNAINDKLKQRLATEQLTAQQRDEINQQISRNEAALVEKENQINEKRFKQQKALQIAQALVETYRTSWLAFGSQLVIGDPTSPIRAKIAQAVALAAGLANVAMIARQQFVGKAMPTPNLTAQGLGGAGGEAGPQFNVIGATGQNQLAAAIAGVQQQPVRAYVVSNEVTTAQSLDRNIVAEASL